MSMKCTKPDFSNQDVHVGLDISKKSWIVCIYLGLYFHRTFSQPPDPEVLVHYLRQNFPGGRYHCVYEAGYFGFWIYEALRQAGIDCMVVNPADVPTAHRERRRKTDRVDANKLARSLAAGELSPIFVPNRQQLEDRTLVRMRARFVQHQTRCKNRIKALLQYYGISTPNGMVERHWSRAYLGWLQQVRLQHESGNHVLALLLGDLLAVRMTIADLTKQIRCLAQRDSYRELVVLLCTIPGISLMAAMVLLTELLTIDRFKSLDHLASYAGLVPGEHSSGEREITTGLTCRRNTAMRLILIECAWTAIKRDPALLMCFNQYAATMPKNKAIIKIARKLLNRIRFVMKNRQPYQLNIVQAA